MPEKLILNVPITIPAEIKPSTEPSIVTFIAKVTGSYYPDFLYLDEVNEYGQIIQQHIATLKDDGKNGDQVAGDRKYSGNLVLSSVSSIEKFYSVRNESSETLQSVSSLPKSLWVNGCPIRVRPSTPQLSVFLSGNKVSCLFE